MDIRIGNDIRLNVAISDFDILEGETIKCAHCFLMCEAEKRLSDVDPKSIKLPTKYTLHNYGGRIYNVLPFNVQVRPCGGPGLFGKSLRQYGRPIYTRVSEEDGYIYGYFQEDKQYMLGDYYLVVMLVLDREKYGRREKRHIVVDYGYVFTLTMDGDVCDPDGIYVSRQKDKLPNTITWDVDPSQTTYRIGDTVTFSAHAVDGSVTFDKQSPTTFTGDGMVITATSQNTASLIGQIDIKTLRLRRQIQNNITFNAPSSVATGTEVTLQATAVYGEVTFTAEDMNGNTVQITNNKITVTKDIKVTATSYGDDEYVSKSVERTISCLAQGYYGASSTVPVEVSTTNPITLTGQRVNVSIVTTLSDHVKCHWVAIPTSSGYTVTQLKDADNDDLTEYTETTTIGDYTVYYYQDSVNIDNISNFTITQ